MSASRKRLPPKRAKKRTPARASAIRIPKETPPEWRRKDGQPVSILYQEIWRVVRRIPAGRVATYGQIAELAGRPGQPRLAGYAMRSLPDGANVPWHRVVNAQGAVSTRSGWTAGGEESFQRALLEREGVTFDSHGRLDLAEYRWRPRAGRGRSVRS